VTTHDHDHDHPTLPDAVERLGYYQRMEIAVRELLIEKGIVTADAIRRAIEAMDARNPAQGARVVARAWCDAAFKQRLLDNGTAACEELGVEMGPTRLVVVENTPGIHNLIVCTLCSCYPRTLLGPPPPWYKSLEYRSRTVREPRKVLEEFGLRVPDDVQIRVHDSTADMRYMVLPVRPKGTEKLDEAGLAELVTRDSLIGTGVPAGAAGP
jgi:nitrile hydratase subunit alpha